MQILNEQHKQQNYQPCIYDEPIRQTLTHSLHVCAYYTMSVINVLHSLVLRSTASSLF